MSPIAAALDSLSTQVADLTAAIGRRVDPRTLGVLDRAGQLPLATPGLASPNGACRLFPADDGWMALNLARDEDRDLIPAWLGAEAGDDPWAAIAAQAPGQTRAVLIAQATLLGLPAAAVGETQADTFDAPLIRHASGGSLPGHTLRVIDLTALWAGPMCGGILAAMGAQVTKVESTRRPDPTIQSTPDFFQRLNGGKALAAFDFATPDGRARLHDRIAQADVLITSARPRAFAGLGLEPAALFAANPRLVWTAITGHGWTGPAADRVGFGDDTAAAGGLVRWTVQGEPHFLGDALADPVTGLAAAAATLRAVMAGGGLLADVALARSAAAAAAFCGLARAA